MEQDIKTAIGKLLKILTPKGVSHVDFNITKHSDGTYSMGLQYVVPDDSEYLKDRDIFPLYYKLWNMKIAQALRNYLDVKVTINQSGITSQTFYDRLK